MAEVMKTSEQFDLQLNETSDGSYIINSKLN